MPRISAPSTPFTREISALARHALHEHHHEQRDRKGADEGGILTGEKFEMRPVKKPTEAEVLRMVAKRLEDPRWQERIAQRLKQLGR